MVASSSITESADEDMGASDDEMDWEEIQVPHDSRGQLKTTSGGIQVGNSACPSGSRTLSVGSSSILAAGNLEITIKRGKTVEEARKKQAELNTELRGLRLRCHKIHTVALLGNALVRNKWINDLLLHGRLLSMCPMALQTSFDNITKKRFPEAAKRGRLFETALMRLTQWWFEEFFEIRDYGHIRSRTFNEVQKQLQQPDYEDDDGELIKNEKSLMKYALMRKGSRDTSAQLFTSLCRALGLPARLVVSLQSVPWQASVGKPKTTTKDSDNKGKGRTPVVSEAGAGSSSSVEEQSDEGASDMEEVTIPLKHDRADKGKMSFPGRGQSLNGQSQTNLKGKGKASSKHTIKLRKARFGKKIGRKGKGTPPPPIGGFPPVFWTEVFSRPDGRWMPVDPTRNITNKRKVFEPPPHDKNNRMVYVVAVEEDGYCRDVTARYARDYGSKTSKAQLGGRGRQLWWEYIMSLISRPYRLQRDDVEDEEFEFNIATEAMPTSMAGFKNHPIYALDKHLKREEVIYPRKEIGKFRGEPVFPRANVIPLKTAENWMRTGRRVNEGAQAMKWVKQRAVTVQKRRAMEVAQQEGEEMLQGLYSLGQTELYIPPPVVDGKIPKNDFGNIDLYAPSMLPTGAVHIPYRGAAKTAKKLGFDYAEAVTSFEFKKGRAIPVIQGIVIAEENEQNMLEAYWESERDAEEKEQAKRRDRCLKRWAKLINGLRIYYRLKDQYAKPEAAGDQDNQAMVNKQANLPQDEGLAGGFLTEADSIVQPFHLPRLQHAAQERLTEKPVESVNGGTVPGTAAEREASGELPFDHGTAGTRVKLSIPERADLASTVNPRWKVHMDKERDDGSDKDAQQLFPQAFTSSSFDADNTHEDQPFRAVTKGSGTPPSGMPKSMLEIAEERRKRSTSVEIRETEMGWARGADGGATLEQQGQSWPAANGALRRRGHAMNSTSNPKEVPRVSKRKIAKRKRDASEESALTDDNDCLNATPLDDSGEEVFENLTEQSTRKRSTREQRHTKSQAPAPSTRVLRSRALKSPEKLRAEAEAEAALSKALEGR